MKHKKTARTTILVSAALIAAAVLTACALGAEGGSRIPGTPKIELTSGHPERPADISGDTNQPGAATAITEADAKSIALRHAGLNESDVAFIRVKRDREDGRDVYDVEFYSGNTEYDYEIDAADGRILESSQERD